MNEAGKLLARLSDLEDTIWRHRYLVASVLGVLLIVEAAIVFSLKPQYVAGANLLVVNGNTREDPTLSSPDLPSIATSTIILDRVINDLNLDTTLLALKRRLTVKAPAFKSSILRIEYTDTNPTQAAAISNAVADELTHYYGQISRARYDADLNALGTEMQRQQTRVTNLSAEMVARGGSPQPYDDKTGDGSAPRTADLEADRELANASLSGDSASASLLSTSVQHGPNAFRHDVLQSDQRYHDLLAALSTNDVALDEAHALYTPNYPEFIRLQNQHRDLTNALTEERRRALSSPDAFSSTAAGSDDELRKAQALVVADRAKVSALDRLIGREKVLQAAQAPLEVLRLQRAAAESEYLAISSRRATALTDRADALSLGSVVVVDRAIASETRVGLGRHAIVVILTLLALIGSVASAFLADAFDPRLRRISQIEDLYGRPVVATIGKI